MNTNLGIKKGRRNSWIVGYTFLICDTAILYSVFFLAVVIRNMLMPLFVGSGSVSWESITPLAKLGVLFGIVVLKMEGLYPGYGMTAVTELQRMSKSVTLVFFFLTAISYLNKPFQDISRGVLLISWLLTIAILPLSHFILRNVISRFAWYGIPVVVFGDGAWAEKIVTSLRQVRRLGWYPTTVLPIKAIKHGMVEASLFDVAFLAPSSKLPMDTYARVLNQSFRKVILIRQTKNLGSVWVEPHDIDGELGLEFHYKLFDTYAKWVKRFLDFGIGLVLSILLSPILVILCLCVSLDSPGPIFYVQERLGKSFKRFNLIKFRTMKLDADQRLIELLRSDPVAQAEYKKYHKLTNDPRLTRIGKWMRRFSLDELPQLVNVLRGEMSTIGPRAYLPSELGEIGDYAPIILRISPGMTGWWQVMGRHNTTFHERLRMDEYYISNWSLWMDCYILLKTAWAVLGGEGA